MLKVLLVSPKDPDTPLQLHYLMGGESTYTKLLLKYPPKQVQFIHHEEALKQGAISYTLAHYFFIILQKLRVLPLGPRAQLFAMHTYYDLVYAHGYPVYYNNKVPLIISDSSSNIVFLKFYLHLPAWQIKIQQKFKKILYQIFCIIDGEVNTQKSRKRFVFSKWAQETKKNECGITNFQVIYPGLPPAKKKKRGDLQKIKILFVGMWFERKGGRTLLAAFGRIRKKYSDVELTVVGELPQDICIDCWEGIVHYDFVSYAKLLNLYENHQILVHIPAEIEGYGMAVCEALSFGLSCIVSNRCALPEFVQDRKSGFVIEPTVAELERILVTLVTSPKLRQKISSGAQLQFQKQFSLYMFQEKLYRLMKASRRMNHLSILKSGS